MTARTLVLVRHAKAEGSAATDHQRELSGQGDADAAAMGSWLVEGGYSFDAVVCSTSTRTRQTWSSIEGAGVSAEEVFFDGRAYVCGPDVMLQVLTEIPGRMRNVLVIGHAPTIPELADLLADSESSDQDAIDALRSSFPAGCLAVLTVDVPWAALEPGSATLSEVTTPRA